MGEPWGRIAVCTRLEKIVSARFFQTWTNFITRGLRPDDAHLTLRGKPPHKAANILVRQFLKSDLDSVFFLDSDAEIEPEFLETFREFEPGWDYDVFQAFYVRRGWPPSAIWIQKSALGDHIQVPVWDPDLTDDVAVVGLHTTLIRRHVFEALLGDADPETWEWFHYPRHKSIGEDALFCDEAIEAGFRIGATSAVKAGHLSELATGWEIYQDYMRLSGENERLARMNDLALTVAKFTGEEPDMVVAKSLRNKQNTQEPWGRYAPETPEEYRAFYGAPDNGYLYELLLWNCSVKYGQATQGLRDVEGETVLVVGAGLGTEVDLLREQNTVDVYELPGVLREFLRFRFKDELMDEARGDKLRLLSGKTVEEALDMVDGQRYDRVVAVDVLEHIHPDEFDATMDALANVTDKFYFHLAYSEHILQECDPTEQYLAWLGRWGIKQTGEYVWEKGVPDEA